MPTRSPAKMGKSCTDRHFDMQMIAKLSQEMPKIAAKIRA